MNKILNEMKNLSGNVYAPVQYPENENLPFYELELALHEIIGDFWGETHIFFEPFNSISNKIIYSIYPDSPEKNQNVVFHVELFKSPNNLGNVNYTVGDIYNYPAA